MSTEKKIGLGNLAHMMPDVSIHSVKKWAVILAPCPDDEIFTPRLLTKEETFAVWQCYCLRKDKIPTEIILRYLQSAEWEPVALLYSEVIVDTEKIREEFEIKWKEAIEE